MDYWYACQRRRVMQAVRRTRKNQGGQCPFAPPIFDWAKISSALTDLLTAFLIPAAAFAARWLFAKGSVEYGKLTEAQRVLFKSFLRTAIYATEQMDLAGKVGDRRGDALP